jgi:hypothetical protein
MASRGCEYWVDLLIVVCFDKVGGTFSFFFLFDNKWLQFWMSAFMILDCIRRIDNMAQQLPQVLEVSSALPIFILYKA